MDDELKSKYFKDIEYFSAKIKKDPNSKCYMPLAFAYMSLDKYDETIEICEKGLEKHPNYIPLAVLLGKAFLKKGMIEEAKAILEGVVHNVPQNFKSAKLLGDIYKSENKLDEAIKYYNLALERNPESKELKQLLEELQGGGLVTSGEKENEATPDGLDDKLESVMDDLFKKMNLELKSKTGEDDTKDVLLKDELTTIKDMADKYDDIENFIKEKNNIQKDKKKMVLNKLNNIISAIEERKKSNLYR